MSTTPRTAVISRVRRTRAYDEATSSHGRAGPTTASRPVSRRSRRVRRRPPRSGTSSSTRSSSSLTPGRSWRASTLPTGSAGTSACTCPPGSSTAVRVVGGCQPARAAAEVTVASSAPASSSWREALEVALAHPAARGELVGVSRHARGRQLVDVGEDELGEAGHRARGHAGVRGRGRHLAPGHAGADAVGRLQRVHRPAAARLAATEVVGRLEGGRQRRARVGARGARRELEEAAERDLDRAGDRGAEVAGEGTGVRRHLGGHRRHRRGGDVRQPLAQGRGDGRLEGEVLRGRAGGGAVHLCPHRTMHGGGFTSDGQEFRPSDESPWSHGTSSQHAGALGPADPGSARASRRPGRAGHHAARPVRLPRPRRPAARGHGAARPHRRPAPRDRATPSPSSSGPGATGSGTRPGSTCASASTSTACASGARTPSARTPRAPTAASRSR